MIFFLDTIDRVFESISVESSGIQSPDTFFFFSLIGLHKQVQQFNINSGFNQVFDLFLLARVCFLDLQSQNKASQLWSVSILVFHRKLLFIVVVIFYLVYLFLKFCSFFLCAYYLIKVLTFYVTS